MNARTQSRPCDRCHRTGVNPNSREPKTGVKIWCGCVYSFCAELGFFDAGRGDETHTCYLRLGHEGDHAEGHITWQS